MDVSLVIDTYLNRINLNMKHRTAAASMLVGCLVHRDSVCVVVRALQTRVVCLTFLHLGNHFLGQIVRQRGVVPWVDS